jgi:hypothetical protein
VHLKDFRDYYYDHSAKASEIQRQIAFAGIAVIWIFRTGSGVDYRIPLQLITSTILFVASLASAFLQYLTASIMWGLYTRIKELKGITDTDDFKAPRWINWPGNTFFFLKFLFVIIAYYMLLKYLIFLIM